MLPDTSAGARTPLPLRRRRGLAPRVRTPGAEMTPRARGCSPGKLCSGEDGQEKSPEVWELSLKFWLRRGRGEAGGAPGKQSPAQVWSLRVRKGSAGASGAQAVREREEGKGFERGRCGPRPGWRGRPQAEPRGLRRSERQTNDRV